MVLHGFPILNINKISQINIICQPKLLRKSIKICQSLMQSIEAIRMASDPPILSTFLSFDPSDVENFWRARAEAGTEADVGCGHLELKWS